MAEPIAFPGPEWFAERVPYLEVRIERTAEEWRVWFHGKPAGRSDADAIPRAAEIRLIAEGGTLRMDSALLQNLMPKPM